MLAACRSRTGSSRAPSNSRWRRRSRSAPGSTHSSNYRLAPERAEAAQSARSSGSSRKPTSKHDSSSPTASPAGSSHCVRQGLQEMQQRGKLNRSANPDRLETATLAGSRAASSPAEPDATQTKPARRRPRRRIRPPTHARGRNNPRRWLARIVRYAVAAPMSGPLNCSPEQGFCGVSKPCRPTRDDHLVVDLGQVEQRQQRLHPGLVDLAPRCGVVAVPGAQPHIGDERLRVAARGRGVHVLEGDAI